ncbi:MAG: hypothetical protein ACOC1U_09800 [Spirochaetota bacterium]
MMNRTRTMLALTILLALVGACTQNPIGVFESLELEREILDDRNLPNNATVAAMARVDSGSVGRYFVAAGTLFYRTVDDPSSNDDAVARPEWQAGPAPDGAYTPTSLVAADLGSGEKIYVVYAADDGTSSGLYEIDPAAETMEARLVFSSDTSGVASVDRVFTVNDGTEWLLVAVTMSGSGLSRGLYATDNAGNSATAVEGSEFTPIIGVNAQVGVIDVATNGTQVAYLTAASLLVHASGVDTGTAPETRTPSESGTTLEAGDRYTGTVYAGGALWLADDGGHLYRSTDFGTNWTQSSVSNGPDGNPLEFTDFGTVPESAEVGAATTLLVGTRGSGYRVMGDVSNATTTTELQSPAVDGSNYQASDLAGAAVTFFFTDPVAYTGYPVPTSNANTPEENDGYLIFAGSVTNGLWRALSYDGPIQWVRE